METSQRNPQTNSPDYSFTPVWWQQPGRLGRATLSRRLPGARKESLNTATASCVEMP